MGAPKAKPGRAPPTPRPSRGSGSPPRVPGGAAVPKALKRRRRPNQRQRRHEKVVAEDDAAAAAVSPFNSLRLSTRVWAALGAGPWVLRTILYGLRIPWVSTPKPTRSRGYPMPYAELVWCRTEVDRWVGAGYVRRLSKAVGAGSSWVSPTFVVHGPKDRMVVDLRQINHYIAARPFKYQRLAGFLAGVLPDEHLISWDVKDAFYHIRIFPAHRRYFRFVVDGVVYEPRVLPFGMRLSPWAWTKMLRPVVAALRLRGFHMMAYVDDFASTGRDERPSSAASATAGRVEIVRLFADLGLHVHATKGVAAGTTRLPILGFLADTRRRVLVLPKERLDKVIRGAKALLSAATSTSRRVSAKALTRFTGTAVSCSLAIPSARFYLRRLYDAQTRRTGTTLLSHGAVRDLQWFTRLRREPGVGRALWPTEVGVLTTDASPWGWGGHWGDLLPAAGFFSLQHRSLHINVKELVAVRFCLLAFGPQLAGKLGVLRLRVDSRVAMHVVNSFSSRSPVIMQELRKLHDVMQRLGISIEASWLASVANVWADALSRRTDSDDWRLHPGVYEALVRRYGQHTVDRFASPLNAVCPRFNTQLHAPGTEAVDAFAVWWGGAENNWINAPFSQASRVLDKVIADKATATVILPVWTAQEWWEPAVARAQEAWLLPQVAGIFSAGRSQRPAPHPTWRVAVFRFEQGGRSEEEVQRQRSATARAYARETRKGLRLAAAGAVTRARSWRVPRPAAALMELPLDS